MFGTKKPIAEDLKESLLTNFGRRVEILGKGTNRQFVNLEEEAILAAEVLEDRTLGNTQTGGDITDAHGVISMLSKMLRRGFDDACALGLRSWPQLGVPLVKRRRDAITGNPRHNNNDSRSGQHTVSHCRLQLHLSRVPRLVVRLNVSSRDLWS